jgi:signal transduction histidine kinase
LEDALREPGAVLKLDLSNRGLVEFPAEILRLPNLRMLLLNQNRLSSLPRDLGRLSRLSELELNYNEFTVFPPEILELAALNELELSGNRIAVLPDEIGRLAQLTEIELLDNQLAALPAAVASLVHLEELKLDRNRLASLPEEIFSLGSLQELTLSGNLLTTLPGSIGGAPALRELDVSRNRISVLPDALFRLRPARAVVWQESLARLPPPQLEWLLSLGEHDVPDFVLQFAEARRADDVVYYFEAYRRAAEAGGTQAEAQSCLVGARAFRDLGDEPRARELAGRARDLFSRLAMIAHDDDHEAAPHLARATMDASIREARTLFDLVETEAYQTALRSRLRSALLVGLALTLGFCVLLVRNHRRLRAAHSQLSRQTAQLEEQAARLERLNSTKDRLFSLIGHDLRGPLSAMGTLSSRLRPELTTTSAQRLVSLLEGTALQLSALLDNLLRWAQTQIREDRFAPAIVDLGELVDRVVGQYRALLAVKEIELRANVGRGLHVFGDVTMLETIVRNLLANAVKFSETGDRIAIDALVREGEIVLEVADTGVGMSDEQIARLFARDAAQSLEGTLGERGTGLGLLLCGEFVRRHEGRIEVRSTAGEGSLFRVVLPACGLLAAG